MPVDGGGNYRHTSQVARMHDSGKAETPKVAEAPAEAESGEHTEVHAHGDGTFHTVHGGEQAEHANIGEMHAHLSSIHGQPGEKHFHAHNDGIEAHSHSVETGGEPEHRDAEDTEGMKTHLGEAMGDEAQDQDDPQVASEPAAKLSALGV